MTGGDNLKNVLWSSRMIYPLAKAVGWYKPLTASLTKFSCSLGWFGSMAWARLTDCNINRILPAAKQEQNLVRLRSQFQKWFFSFGKSTLALYFVNELFLVSVIIKDIRRCHTDLSGWRLHTPTNEFLFYSMPNSAMAAGTLELGQEDLKPEN